MNDKRAKKHLGEHSADRKWKKMTERRGDGEIKRKSDERKDAVMAKQGRRTVSELRNKVLKHF